MKTTKTILSVLCALLLLAVTNSSLHAQLKKARDARMSEVNVNAEAAMVMIRPLETFGHKITVSNNSEDPIKFRLILRDNKYFRQINAITQSYFVNSGDSLRIGLRLLNVNARVNGIYTVFFDMISEFDSTDRKIFEFQVEVIDGTDRQFVIQPLQENIVIKNSIRDFQLPVLFKNLIPETKEVRFEIQNAATNPIQLGKGYSGTITLPANDTLLNIPFVVASKEAQLWQLNSSITVYVKALNGELLGMFSATPHWLYNKGNMYTPGFIYQPANSLQVEAVHQQMSSGVYSDQLRLSKGLAPEKEGIGFNMNYTRYANGIFQNLSGSYLQYRNGLLDLTAGSINEFNELSLFGRGVKSTLYFDEEKTVKVDLYAVDQETNLLEPINTQSGTRTVSGQFSQTSEDKTFGYYISSNYFNRAQNNSKGHLHYTGFTWKLSETETISARVGGSLEKFNYLRGDSTLLGYSVTADYNRNMDRWNIIASVSRGSRNYAGLNQGALIANAFAGYRLTSRSSISYNFTKNTSDRPAYLPQAIQGRFYVNFLTHELNFNKNFKGFEWNVKPYFLKQGQLFSYELNPIAPEKGYAFRLQSTLNGKYKKFSYQVMGDMGAFKLTHSVNGPRSMGTFMGAANIGIAGITLAAVIQKGPSFVTDLSNIKDASKGYFNKSLSLGYGFRIKNKLTYQVAASAISNATITGAIYNINQDLTWRPGKGIEVNASFFMFKYSTIPMRQQYRVGVVKTFNWDRGEQAPVKVTVLVFEDKNANGIRDGKEQPAVEAMVKFDDLILITDKNGLLQVGNVKKGEHKISIIYGSSKQQNYLSQTIDVNKNTKVVLAIPPQFKVSGIVIAPKKRYDNAVVDMDGIKVLLLDRSGKEFITYTNRDGSFSTQLPANTYRVYLPALKLKNRSAQELIITVDAENGYNEPIKLNWVDEGRTVEVKKL